MIMKKNSKIVSIITARGGSKGLVGKNIKLLCGEPMINYTISAALECPLIDKVYVTTDCKNIARVSQKAGANIIMRPESLAKDNSSSTDAVLHALEDIESRDELYDNFILLQPTSPLRNSVHISKAIHDYMHSGKKCLWSICEVEHHPEKMLLIKRNSLHPLGDQKKLSSPRHLLPKVYRQNGSIYITNVKVFKKLKTFYIPPVLPFLMKPEESIDIDSYTDFMLAETIMLSNISQRKKTWPL